MERVTQRSQQPSPTPPRDRRTRRHRLHDSPFRPSILSDDPHALERLLEPLRLEFAPLEVFKDAALGLEELARHLVLEVLHVAVLEEGLDDGAELGVLGKRFGESAFPSLELQSRRQPRPTSAARNLPSRSYSCTLDRKSVV